MHIHVLDCGDLAWPFVRSLSTHVTETAASLLLGDQQLRCIRAIIRDACFPIPVTFFDEWSVFIIFMCFVGNVDISGGTELPRTGGAKMVELIGTLLWEYSWALAHSGYQCSHHFWVIVTVWGDWGISICRSTGWMILKVIWCLSKMGGSTCSLPGNFLHSCGLNHHL